MTADHYDLPLPHALFLLLLDPEKGTPLVGDLDVQLVASGVGELLIRGALRPTGKRHTPVEDGPNGPGNGEFLRALHGLLTEKDKPLRTTTLVRRAMSRLKPRLAVGTELAGRGIVRQDRVRALGLIPVDYWRLEDADARRSLIAHLADTLETDGPVGTAELVLIKLLKRQWQLRAVFGQDLVRERKERIKALTRRRGPEDDILRAGDDAADAVIVLTIVADTADASGDGDGGGGE